jgi:hypothetical protein
MDSYYIGDEVEIRPPIPAHTLAGTRYLPDGMDDTGSEIVVIDHGDHSCIAPRDNDQQTHHPEAILGDVQGLLDTLGPGYTYRGAFRINDLAGEHPAAPHVWRTTPGVALEVIETVGPEGYADGGAVLVVQVGGLRVASRWLDWKDLASAEYGQDGQPTRPQLDAAVEALDVTAWTVNQVVEQHRAVRAADAAARTTLTTIPSLTGQLRLADVECALRTLADLWNGADLGDAGDPHDVLSTRQRQVAETVCALVAAEHERDRTNATPTRTDDH